MSSTVPLEQRILRQAEDLLAEALKRHLPEAPEDARLAALEATASRIGGFCLERYWSDQAPPEAQHGALRQIGASLAQALSRTPIHPSLALCCLARPRLDESRRRREGVYYTDFRLAGFVADQLAPALREADSWLDPACGTGILLVAAVLRVAGDDPTARARMLAERVRGADLDPRALRGARLALASLSDDAIALQSMRGCLREGDSLLRGSALWCDLDPTGPALVLGNPPWEKLKLSRHEFLREQGSRRHYGADYTDDNGSDRPAQRASLRERRAQQQRRVEALCRKLDLRVQGELDLYSCFLKLSLQLVRSEGQIALLLPAGLIRSQGTGGLRRALLEGCDNLELTVMHNRARFFAIDTRCKFLLLRARRGPGPATLHIAHARGHDRGVERGEPATIEAAELQAMRPDLTVPEVRDAREWRLFAKAFERGLRLDDPASPFPMRFVRELDMTGQRALFSREKSAGSLPVIEGRMVHQFHFGAKRYLMGAGRAARWQASLTAPSTPDNLHPQFWLPADATPEGIRARVQAPRIGFCDVTGQTNERSMLATMIPPGVACGNKVPTLTLQLPAGNRAQASWVWLGVANSFVFDWLLRRVITTSVNFFLLRSVCFPRLALDSAEARAIALNARALVEGPHLGAHRASMWQRAETRAALDLSVCQAYGYDASELAHMLEDFPLLDRGQPALPGEDTSSVTRDLLMLRAMEAEPRQVEAPRALRDRVQRARALGAVAYIPAEFAGQLTPAQAAERPEMGAPPA